MLLALADPDGQAAIFDTASGRSLIEGTFLVPSGGLQDVTAVTCRDLMLLPPVEQSGTWLGTVRHPTDGSSWLVDVSPGTTTDETPLDAAVRVHITAGGRAVRSDVTAASSVSLRGAVTLEQCDAYIVARDGGLPDDIDTLEQARLEAAGALLTAAIGIPADFDAQHFFASSGLRSAADVAHWLAAERWPSSVLLDVVTQASPPGTPLQLDLPVHVLVAQHDPVHLRAELGTVQAARRGLETSGAARPQGPWPLRTPYPVLLVVPDAFLDDEDLPLPDGPVVAPPARPAARLVELNRRLRPVGVAVTTT